MKKHLFLSGLIALILAPMLVSAQTSATYTAEQVATHNVQANCWMTISNKVYDVTAYLSAHPGGRSIMLPLCGKDATADFNNRGGTGSHSNSAKSLLPNFQIGTIVAQATPINGACGTANGVSVSAAPSTGLCAVGTASVVSGTGPFSWTCAGQNQGTTASCTAPLLTQATTTPPVATTTPATTTPPVVVPPTVPVATSTFAINHAYTVCTQFAITKRDTALLAARVAYNTSMTQALTARTQAETAAIALTDLRAQQTALTNAKNAYKAVVKTTQNTLTSARKVALTTYEADIAKCKAARKASLASGTILVPATSTPRKWDDDRKDNKKNEKDDRGRDHDEDDDRKNKSSSTATTVAAPAPQSNFSSNFLRKFEDFSKKFKNENKEKDNSGKGNSGKGGRDD